MSCPNPTLPACRQPSSARSAIRSCSCSWSSAAIMVATNDHIGASTITVMVLISVGLNTTQEYKATRAAQALRAMVVATTTVIRQGKASEIPVAQVVPGDIIELKAGDLIPADLRVVRVKDLTVSQSSLTGESRPQDKTARPATAPMRTCCMPATSVSWAPRCCPDQGWAWSSRPGATPTRSHGSGGGRRPAAFCLRPRHPAHHLVADPDHVDHGADGLPAELIPATGSRRCCSR